MKSLLTSSTLIQLLRFLSTADPDFLLLQLMLLLSSTTDQTSHFRMRPVLFPPKRPNEQLVSEPVFFGSDHTITAIIVSNLNFQIGKSKFWNRGRRPPPPVEALPPRAIVRARQRDDRSMNAHVARPGETICANCCATPPLEARCLAPAWAIAGGRLARFCCPPLRRSTALVCCAPWSTLAGRCCDVLLCARLAHVVDGAPRLSRPRAPLAARAISSIEAACRPPLRRCSGESPAMS
ncbi:hypothetical protein F511_43101 [Dorcoceras hygrometricum]|uniref:Uncharacterized protein n=1 Tax=Dorcoceras hygrometricum TaxID=472368 RepID=A0A2Z7BKN3_9LAMI|nr:hypothetical protein F511_43101 [Dorcoceras hygrometricum]